MHRTVAIALAAAALTTTPGIATARVASDSPGSDPAAAQALEALRIRSEALNDRYSGVRPVPSAVSGDGFDWTDAGIGAGAGIALALLGAGGSVAVSRKGHARLAHS